MRKRFRATSIFLSVALLLSMAFPAASAFAAEDGDPTTIVSDGFDAAETLELNTRTFYDVELSREDVSLAADSSDKEVLNASVQPDTQNPGFFTLILEAWKTGKATITLTTSDGTTDSREITVEDGAPPAYTATSDTTSDFSLPAGNSRYITIHYTSENFDANPSPTLISGDDSAVHVEAVGADYDSGDYYFRVDAAGKDGQSAQLSLGSSDSLPVQKLCTVTIAENKDLRIDTQSTYVCNLGDTYDFVVYTAAKTAPEVSAVNSLVSVDFVEAVNGGYKYEMTAEDTGDSLVQAKTGDETAAFAVKINYIGRPSVVSADPKEATVEQGKTYVYHFDIMGGGVPQFVTDPADAVAVQSVEKNGIHYACTVKAAGDVGSSSELYVRFPDSGDDSFDVDFGKITVAEKTGTLKSDTNSNFTVPYGQSYQFKITGATSFYAGSSGAFNIVKAGESENAAFYRITAIGKPGDAAGLYMYNPDQGAVLVCVATVGPVALSSDTNSNLSLAAGASYQYKITAPGITNASDLRFNTGNSGVVQTTFVKKQGNDFFYRVTAAGNPGEATGVYVSALGQKAQLVNVVTVKPVVVTSDTNSDFSLSKGQSYQFKITAPGASAVNFNAGSAGVVSVALVSHKDSDFFFKVTAVGKSGQAVGIYAGPQNQTARKLCVITVK